MTWYEAIFRAVDDPATQGNAHVVSGGMDFLVQLASLLSRALQNGELSADAVISRQNATSVEIYDELHVPAELLQRCLRELGKEPPQLVSEMYLLYLSEV